MKMDDVQNNNIAQGDDGQERDGSSLEDDSKIHIEGANNGLQKNHEKDKTEADIEQNADINLFITFLQSREKNDDKCAAFLRRCNIKVKDVRYNKGKYIIFRRSSCKQLLPYIQNKHKPSQILKRRQAVARYFAHKVPTL